MTISVNGKNYEVEGEFLTYEGVVGLAYPGRAPTSYLVSYSYRNKSTGGTLALQGQGADLEPGMMFNCYQMDP